MGVIGQAESIEDFCGSENIYEYFIHWYKNIKLNFSTEVWYIWYCRFMVNYNQQFHPVFWLNWAIGKVTKGGIQVPRWVLPQQVHIHVHVAESLHNIMKIAQIHHVLLTWFGYLGGLVSF